MKLFCVSVPVPNVQQQQTPAAVAAAVPTIPPGQNVLPAPVVAAVQPAAPPPMNPVPIPANAGTISHILSSIPFRLNIWVLE